MSAARARRSVAYPSPVRSTRRLLIVVIAAVAVGLPLGFVKGDSAGVRGAVGNLSAPWLLIGMFAGLSASTLQRGAAAGVVATGAALVAFYAALTVVLAGQLGGGGALHEFATEVNANRVYFLFGLCAGPPAGMIGARLRPRREWAPVVAGATVAGEVFVVAAVSGHELLPPPIYFAWAVDDWRPYVAECVLGLALLGFGLWRQRFVLSSKA